MNVRGLTDTGSVGLKGVGGLGGMQTKEPDVIP